MNKKILISIIVFLIIAGGVWWSTSNKSSEQHNAEVMVSGVDTSNWSTYKSEELGFSFKYPAGLGELEEFITPGNTGFKFTLTTKKKPSPLKFSGVTLDYQASRGGSFGDSQGYQVDDGKYYFIFTNNKLVEFGVEEIVEAAIGDIIIIDPVSMENTLIGPGRNNFGALVNIDSERFRGLSIWSNLEKSLIYSVVRTLDFD